MSDNAELHSKILTFLAGEFARKEGRQCVGVDLLFAPGNGFREEEIRKWVRHDEPDFFDSFVKIEELVKMIVDIAEGEADAKPAGKHRFVIRTHQHMGGRGMHSFALSPTYSGSSDETALVAGGGGGGRPDVIANHAGQLMRINAQMFEGTIRVLSQQNTHLHEQIMGLTSENAAMRVELEEARSNKLEREFQIHMTAEKNARTNAGFQKLLQLGTVVAAKIGGDEGSATGGASPLAMLIGEFGQSLRQDQIGVLMNTLDMAQKIMFMEIMNMVAPPEQKAPNPASSAPASLPSSGASGATAPNGPKL